METVNFYPQTLNEIPHQDNPANSKDICLLIVKDHPKSSHAVVLEINAEEKHYNENIGFVAKFQSEKLAIEYCSLI
jgi:hypothetical protein